MISRQRSTLPVRFAIALAGALALTAPVTAQETEWDANAARMTRPTLEGLLARYERAAESSAYSEALREEAREQAEFTRRRLEQGDFRAGDRVYILVEDYGELTDTLSVASDQTITLPGARFVTIEAQEESVRAEVAVAGPVAAGVRSARDRLAAVSAATPVRR